MSDSNKKYNEYKTKMRQIADLRYASAVLQWDQETYMPKNGNEARGRQIATLNELAHEQFTSDSMGKMLEELLPDNSLDEFQKRNIELSYEDYVKNKKLPSSLVRKTSESVNESFHAWIQARSENNFSVFQQPLQKVIDCKREEAELLGYKDHPYDALMNEYDRGLTVAFTDKLFSDLQPRLSSLLDKIQKKPQVDNSFLKQQFSKKDQWDFGIELLKELHYDFDSGRQDISEHPFTTNFSSKDVRVTTRVDENDLANMTWSCIHEGGHALYEQGLPDDEYGLPLGEYCSLSIHESQSRLWENCIGRSLEFWKHHFPKLVNRFPMQFENVSAEQFFAGINKVEPSLIRTEADELTYHFHVMIRYEIEKRLIKGEIYSTDIPELWNQLYKKYLGVNVPDHKKGCLQDVHWSHGSFGYFATYSIGSLYAAQFFASIKKQNPGILSEIEDGNTTDVWEWLKQHIYKFGRYYNSSELCLKATGEILNPDHFLSYAAEKFNYIYEK